MLASTVSLDDYVVVKVDIDSLGMGAGPELAIVESIAHLPELSTLIDELYFEYHFYFDGATTFGWGGGNFGGHLGGNSKSFAYFLLRGAERTVC